MPYFVNKFLFFVFIITTCFWACENDLKPQEDYLVGTWQSGMPKLQQALLDSLVACLPGPSSGNESLIDEAVKKALATAVRNHYKQHPEALELQASGEITPATVANHQ